MTALDWRNRPYPERTPPPPPDVSAAACAARAERQDRHMRIVGRVVLAVAGMVALWRYSVTDFTRTESMILVAVLLLIRVVYNQERHAEQRQP